MNTLEKTVFDELMHTLNTYGCNIVYKFQDDADFRSKRRRVQLNGDVWTMRNFKWNADRYMFDVVKRECEKDSEEVCEQCTAIIMTYLERLNYLAALRIHALLLDLTAELWYMSNVHERIAKLTNFDKHDPVKLYKDLRGTLFSVKATISNMHAVMDKTDMLVCAYVSQSDEHKVEMHDGTIVHSIE